MLEQTVEEWLITTTKDRGGWCAKMIDAGRRGAPDRELRMPHQTIVFVETKRPKGGKLAPWQKTYHHDLRQLGFPVAVLYTKEAIDEFWRFYDRGHVPWALFYG